MNFKDNSFVQGIRMSTEELLNSLRNYVFPNICTYSSDIYRKEILLYQQSIKSEKTFSFAIMLSSSILLNIASIIYSLQYKDNIINARSTLYQYLSTHYDYHGILHNNFEKNLKKTDVLNSDSVLQYGNHVIKSINKMGKYSDSIRMNLTQFLSSSNSNCRILETEQRRDSQAKGRKETPCYFLPFDQLPELLLLFQYKDGRDFSNIELQKNHLKTPRGKKPMSVSAYKNVLVQINNYYSSKSPDSFENMIHLFRLDQMFLVYKLKKINDYCTIYTSTFFLDHIVKNYALSYEEVLSLKETIICSIFHDNNFMNIILSTKLLDPMLLFDIFFQYEVLAVYPTIKDNTYNGFLNSIAKCKQDVYSTLGLVKSRMDDHIREEAIIDYILAKDKINNLHLDETMNRIKKTLYDNNEFYGYLSYYKISIIRFIQNWTTNKTSSILDFELIKKYLP